MSYEIYIGTESGVHRLTENNGKWQRSGTPFSSNFHPIAMEYDETSNQMLVSFLHGGVVIGDIAADTWSLCDKGLERREIWSLSRIPETQVTFAGTQPAEIWVLEAGSDTWHMLADLTTMKESANWVFPVPPNVPHVRAIASDPLDPDIMYCGIEVGAVLKSEDGGRTWRDLKGVGQDVHRIIPSAENSGEVFIATGDDTPPYKRGGGYGIYFSADGGDTWLQRADGMGVRTYTEDAIALEERDGKSTLYVVGVEDIPPVWAGRGDEKTYFMIPNSAVRERGANAMVYASSNKGEDWVPMMDGLPEFLFDMAWGFDLQEISGVMVLFLATTAGDIYTCSTKEQKWEKLPVEGSFGAITHIRAVSR